MFTPRGASYTGCRGNIGVFRQAMWLLCSSNPMPLQSPWNFTGKQRAQQHETDDHAEAIRRHSSEPNWIPLPFRHVCQSSNKGSKTPSVYCCSCYTTWPAGPSAERPHASVLCRVLDSYQVIWDPGETGNHIEIRRPFSGRTGQRSQARADIQYVLVDLRGCGFERTGWCPSWGLSWDSVNLASWCSLSIGD